MDVKTGAEGAAAGAGTAGAAAGAAGAGDAAAAAGAGTGGAAAGTAAQQAGAGAAKTAAQQLVDLDDGVQGILTMGGAAVVMPQGSIKRLKEKAATRGGTAATDALAKKHGYANLGEMDAALAALRAGKPAPAAAAAGAGAAAGGGTGGAGAAAVVAPVAAGDSPELIQARKDLEAERTARTALERQMGQAEMTSNLRGVCARNGVKDLDFAQFELEREIHGKTEEQIKAFDEKAWFDALRKARPFLFESDKVGATSTAGAGTGTAPNAGTVKTGAGAASQFDARDAKKDDVEARLRSVRGPLRTATGR